MDGMFCFGESFLQYIILVYKFILYFEIEYLHRVNKCFYVLFSYIRETFLKLHK